jgi:RsiW-degrading membrane proteinase PrsW (M82 family)
MFLVLIAFIAIVIWLTWFLLSRDRGSKEPVGALWAAAGFGLLAVFLASVLESTLLSVDATTTSKNLGFLFVNFIGVGIIEELAKFAPLALFIYKKRYFNEHTDGIIYFALCGLTFGLLENIVYTLGFGSKVGLARIFLVPFFHAATTGIAGYFLAKAKVEGKPWKTALLPFVGIMAIHGVYDFGLTTGIIELVLFSIVLTILLTLGLFLFYMRANELDKLQGLSAVGNNKFCRSCGKLNSSRTLFCEYCGKQA